MTWNFILYLLYGLAFFTLGIAILSRDTRLSELGIARIIWLLAVFGIIHGFHEWLELLEQMNPEVKNPSFFLFRLLVVSISFLFLLYFGLFLYIITFYGDQALKTTPRYLKILIGLFALTLICVTMYFDFGNDGDSNTRLFVAFPGALLSGFGLMMYSRVVRTFSTKVAGNFILAGIFMVAYSVFTGVIPSNTVIPLLDVKIIILRGGSAFLIMFFTIRALSVFSLEQRTLINEQLLRFSQSEKLSSMGILAAGIAHEINNPLTNASLNLELLNDMVGGEPKVDKKLESIDRNITRASRIAKELLHFSREKETELEPININQVLGSTKKLLENQNKSSIINLKLQDIPEVMGIPWKLEEVFVNVLLNSLDACEQDDSIDIETHYDADSVMVVIADTGHGISEDNVSQVFDPFFTTKEVGKGTGIGLSVCYNIIKQHGGDISLVSSEQTGTAVTISFPVAIDGN